MIRRFVALALIVGAGLTAAGTQAREPIPQAAEPARSAVLTGTVVTDSATPRPVRRATVRLSGAGATVRLIGTDDNGRFVFDRLPDGRFTVSAEKAGFVRAFHGSAEPGRGPGVPVAVAAGQTVDITIALLPGAAMTGTITDVRGRPAPGINVAAISAHPGTSEPPSPVRGVTDDRGIYRLPGLPPGEYVVAALPKIVPAAEGRSTAPGMGGAILAVTDSDVQWAKSALTSLATVQPPARSDTPARSVAYAPVFYPGTADAAAAATIRVASGEERAGIDITLQIVALARVAGALADGSGQPITSAMVSLVPKRGDQASAVDGLISSGAVTLPRASVSASRFTFAGVGPGLYTLIARTGSGLRGVASPEVTLWSVSDLAMSGADREDVALRLLPGLAVTGRVVFERADTPPVDPSSLNLSFVAVNPLPGVPATYRAAVQPNGTFRIPSLAPGSYFARLDAPATAPAARWTLKSAVANGLDLADRLLVAAADGTELSGVVVTISDRTAGVSGRLTNPSGQAVTRYSIVVFTQDRALWLPGSRRIRMVRPATDGVFQVAGLPAGTYALAAVENADNTNIADPAFLDQLLPSAVTVTLSEGEKRQQDLRTNR